MTTWYTMPEGNWAYSVRPDLWAPGGQVDLVPRHPRGYLSDFGGAWATPIPIEWAGAPGAAEALVMAGLVHVSPGRWWLDWTEVSGPPVTPGPCDLERPITRTKKA